MFELARCVCRSLAACIVLGSVIGPMGCSSGPCGGGLYGGAPHPYDHPAHWDVTTSVRVHDADGTTSDVHPSTDVRPSQDAWAQKFVDGYVVADAAGGAHVFAASWTLEPNARFEIWGCFSSRQATLDWRVDVTAEATRALPDSKTMCRDSDGGPPTPATHLTLMGTHEGPSDHPNVHVSNDSMSIDVTSVYVPEDKNDTNCY